ncbi:hypothetical protein [Bacillus sp. REN16]|nr:hypothetical protein [Bacillus sp. REN16]MCC3358440.1 hypothetical protein [Bacillus sp. REN16]
MELEPERKVLHRADEVPNGAGLTRKDLQRADEVPNEAGDYAENPSSG